MPIFYRYLIKEISMLFIAIVVILNGILLSFRLSHILGRALRGSVSLDAVWQLLEYQGIKFLTILIPLSFLIACLMTLAKMYRDNEIIALLSGGISQNSIRKAICMLTAFVAFILLMITLFILPVFSAKKDATLSQAKQEASYALLDSNAFYQLDDDTVIYVGSNKDSLFENFIIWQKGEHRDFTNMIHAKTGGFTQDHNLLSLDDGIRISWDPSFDKEKFTYANFKTATLNPPDNTSNTYKTESIPTFQLSSSAVDQAELQDRLNPSLALLIFSLFIPIIAYSKPRKQGGFHTLIPAFIIFAIYVNVLGFVTKAIEQNKIAIYPGSYLVHFIALAIILIIWAITRKRI